MASGTAACGLDDDGFEVPSWEGDVALDAFLRECPPQASTRGVFFQRICQQVRKDHGYEPEALYRGVARRRWIVFQAYPLREFLQLAHNAAPFVAGARSTSDGLRRLGWFAYPTFASTMGGRIVLYALGDGLEHVLEVAPSAYGVALPGARVRARRLGERRWRIEMREVYNFVEHYQCGVLEGTVREHGYEPIIRVRRLERRCDADFEVSWEEARDQDDDRRGTRQTGERPIVPVPKSPLSGGAPAR